MLYVCAIQLETMTTTTQEQRELKEIIKDCMHWVEYYSDCANDAKKQGNDKVYFDMLKTIEWHRGIVFKAQEQLNIK